MKNCLSNDYQDMFLESRMRDKAPILKRDKTAHFQNETKRPIFKTGQNSRFSKRNRMSAVTANMHEENLIYLKRFIFVVWLGRFAPFAM